MIKPGLSRLVGTGLNGPDNRVWIFENMNVNEQRTKMNNLEKSKINEVSLSNGANLS